MPTRGSVAKRFTAQSHSVPGKRIGGKGTGYFGLNAGRIPNWILGCLGGHGGNFVAVPHSADPHPRALGFFPVCCADIPRVWVDQGQHHTLVSIDRH